MDIKINPSLYASVFAVPTAIVDDNIRLAGSASLKTLLWLLRNARYSSTPEQISKALGLSPDDVKDALTYWSERGVLTLDDSIPYEKLQTETGPSPQTNPSEDVIKITDREEKLRLKPSKKPTMAEVVKRGNESTEIKFLLNEAQKVMGRTLTNSDAETLLWLADYCEMPVSVILMAMNFAAARSNADNNVLRMRYVEKIVLSWMDDEIFTVEAAENKIKEITDAESRWRKLQSLLGLERRKASAKEEELCGFIDTYSLSDDLVSAAYNETVNKKGKYSAAYLLGILRKWHENGVSSSEEALLEKKAQTASAEFKTTFNIDEYEKKTFKAPKLRKRKEAVEK